jgi:hypothetical protein
MMLYKRQKLLLDLVQAAGGELAATDLQKLLFLYVHQCETEPSYRFVPYRFGCFSFQSYADRNLLVERGMLSNAEDGMWKLTPKAAPYLDQKRIPQLAHFLTRIAPERGDALVSRLYRLFPYYACRSEIVNRILPDVNDRQQIVKQTPVASDKALFTIGYEGDSIDGYLDRLIRNNVSLLCDVRRNPLSRKAGFSREQLASYCAKVQIDYVHLPELGIPSHRRQELTTQKDYDILFDVYRREDLPTMRPAILQLGKLMEKHQRIALTCFEKEHTCCHRHCVADEMKKLIKGCPQPVHI